MPEIKIAYYTINANVWTINIELYKKADRDDHGGRLSSDVENELVKNLSFIPQNGWVLESAVEAGGPPA
ncbi:MAG: hypothetical protein H6766_06565 [Candidatus Peribacteria bacterium]|nr:MAG: hypothetical protein H6766_06565 [Candidatus Peribacteria bacterium]